MSDPLVHVEEVELGGKTRSLSYPFSALERFEKMSGRNAMDAGSFKAMTAGDWITFIWAGLQAHESGLKREAVAGWLTLAKLSEIQPRVIAAYMGAQPEASEDDTPRPPVAAEH